MVKAALRLTFAAGFTLLLAASLSARQPADYRLGDTLTEDILTPVPLTVVDPAATEALKLKETTRVPIVLRFDASAADKVEEDVRAAFAANRSNFLNAVQASFNRRRLNDASIALPKFQRVIATFKKHNKGFPLTTTLAEQWARGDSGRVVQAAVIARIREAMEQPIRPGAWPENLKLSHLVRLVALSNSDETITLAVVDQRGVNVPRTDLLILNRARTNLQSRFPSDEAAWAKFAATCLRANCFVDVELTRQARARQAEAVSFADNYEVGQVIARSGQVVDKKILAALEQLREKTAPVRLQEQITVEAAQAAQSRRRQQWLFAGLASVTVLLAAIVWRLTRRKRTTSLLPARVASGAVISRSSWDETIAVGSELETWQRRALAAEKSAALARAAVRSGVLAQMARLFQEKLVHGLIFQRKQLVETQETAAAEMVELERRLSELRTPLQERLRAYEKRIAELEKALVVKGEENRELIKAKIQLTRRQLEAERSRNPVEFN